MSGYRLVERDLEIVLSAAGHMAVQFWYRPLRTCTQNNYIDQCVVF
jgi:hypothetical protein